MDGKTKLDEKKLRAEFEASEVLQAEFGRDIDAYLAFKKADAAGRVHACGSEGCSMMSSGRRGGLEEAVRGIGKIAIRIR